MSLKIKHTSLCKITITRKIEYIEMYKNTTYISANYWTGMGCRL